MLEGLTNGTTGRAGGFGLPAQRWSAASSSSLHTFWRCAQVRACVESVDGKMLIATSACTAAGAEGQIVPCQESIQASEMVGGKFKFTSYRGRTYLSILNWRLGTRAPLASAMIVHMPAPIVETQFYQRETRVYFLNE